MGGILRRERATCPWRRSWRSRKHKSRMKKTGAYRKTNPEKKNETSAARQSGDDLTKHGVGADLVRVGEPEVDSSLGVDLSATKLSSSFINTPSLENCEFTELRSPERSSRYPFESSVRLVNIFPVWVCFCVQRVDRFTSAGRSGSFQFGW